MALEIKKLHDVSHYKYNDIVVLYRSNYITMEFEAAFTSRNIPYRIYGGQKFYQRREIKDILAYFHLIVNKKDDVSFERIMNVPRRGIGDTTLTTLKEKRKILIYLYTNISKKSITIVAKLLQKRLIH